MLNTPDQLRLRVRDLPHDPFDRAEVQAELLADVLGLDRPSVALVCGSGVSSALAHLGDLRSLPMGALGLPAPRVAGHLGEVGVLELDGTSVLVLAGRVHAYEGYSPSELCAGVRLAAACSTSRLVVTNAAGSIRPQWAPGQLVLIRDHIDLTSVDPLAGEEAMPADRSRFVDMTDAYSARLRATAQAAVGPLPEGVYAARRGPTYETPAEVRMLEAIGADLAGMSTTWEVQAARHLGLEVLGLSLVTNLAAGLADSLDHAEVTAQGSHSAHGLAEVLRQVLTALG